MSEQARQIEMERRSTAVKITKASHRALKFLAIEREVGLGELFQEAVDAYLTAQKRAVR